MTKGPIYGVVELIDSLPINPDRPNGMKQAMPNAQDLYQVAADHVRVSAGFEVLLAHWQHRMRRAGALRDFVLQTWNPPLMGRGSDADVAQTSVMQTLAWAFGKAFLGELTEAQEAAIDQGLELMERMFALGGQPSATEERSEP